MKAKKLASVVIAVICGACAAGCGRSDTSPSSKSAASPGSEAQTSMASSLRAQEETGYTLPIVEEPIELLFLTREVESPGVSFNATPQPLVWQEFEKATNIKIKFDALPSAELKETVQLRLAARQDVPDLITIPGDQTGSYLSRYLKDGVVIPLNDYLDKYGVNYKKVKEEYPVYDQTLRLPDGSIVGLGNLRASQYQFRAQLIRQDWLDKLELPMPTTPDELLETAKKFIENDMNGNGQADEIGMSGYDQQYMELGHAWGLHFVTGDGWDVQDGKIVYEPLTEPYREFLRYIKGCVESGVFPSDWISVDKNTHLARATNDQIGILMREPALSAINFQDPNSGMATAVPHANWQVIPPLDGPYGKGIYVKERMTDLGRTVVVTSSNNYPVETVKWLDYVIFSEEGNCLMQYGIEGKTYEVKDGNIRKLESDLADNKPLADGTWLGYGDYMPGIYTNESDELSFAHLNLASDNPGLIGVQACFPYVEEPFVAPIPTVEDGAKISASLADIKTYVEESRVKFITGEMDLDSDFDKYVANLESVGIRDIIDMYQNQYNNSN